MDIVSNKYYCFNRMYLLGIIFFISSTVYSVENYIQCDRDKPVNNSNYIELKVKLMDSINDTTLPSYCGHAAFCRNYNFAVKEIIKGIYNDTTIVINIICPREYFEKISNVNDTTLNFKLIELKVFPLSEKKTTTTYEIIE